MTPPDRSMPPSFEDAIPTTVPSDHFVQSRHASWSRLFVRRRVPAGIAPKSIRKAILFVHGTFYPGCAFDCSATDYSWLDYMAARGYAAYYVDLRGYGKSSPKPITPADDVPFCGAEEAVEDIGDVIDFILGETSAAKVDLVGYSWGTLTAPMYAVQNGLRVRRLVLVAPTTEGGTMAITKEEPIAPDRSARIFGRGFVMLTDPNDATRLDPAIKAYTRWSITDSSRHATASMRDRDPKYWQSPELSKAALADLHETAGSTSDTVRSPSGAQVNLFEFYIKRRSFYDPAALKVPVLILRGDVDFAGTAAGASQLLDSIAAERKLLLTFGNAGHNLFMQKGAREVFRLVHAFLDEEG